MEKMEEGKYATAMMSKFHLEKSDYEPRNLLHSLQLGFEVFTALILVFWDVMLCRTLL
jgi:hypothetical protein